MIKFDIDSKYSPEYDYFLASRPEVPEMRDTASMWIFDDAGRFALPRFVIESIARKWDDRGVQANIAFPDGRVLIGSGAFAPANSKMVNGKAVTLNAGPLTFEVIEPLRRHHMTFDGAAYETTVQRQAQGEVKGKLRRVRISVDAEMAVPPWSPGERVIHQATAQAFGAVGGHRHEQLFRCKGTFEVEGESVLKFTGTGLRIRRYGARDIGDFPGHLWQSAVFPSGKAFGLSGFPPRADGTPSFNDAYIFEGGKKIGAKVIEGAWMKKFVPLNGDVGATLETDDGRRIRINGKTHSSTFIAKDRPMFGGWEEGAKGPNVNLPFHQGGVLYEWDGETAFGMIERSYPADKVTIADAD